jgi:hypothetical protein
VRLRTRFYDTEILLMSSNPALFVTGCAGLLLCAGALLAAEGQPAPPRAAPKQPPLKIIFTPADPSAAAPRAMTLVRRPVDFPMPVARHDASAFPMVVAHGDPVKHTIQIIRPRQNPPLVQPAPTPPGYDPLPAQP